MPPPTVVAPIRSRYPLDRLVRLRRLTKPELSALILAGTGLAVGLVMLAWLLLWISRAKGELDALWVAQRGLATPVIGHQAEDIRRIARSPRRDTAFPALEESLRARLAGPGRGPVVLYLSAVGVSDGQAAVFLRPEPGAVGRAGSLAADRLIEIVAGSPAPKVLIILDAGQVGSDRDLGVYGNAFLRTFKEALAAKGRKGVAVLASCAPGQTSWTSEGDRRSVFAHFVEQGLAGKAAGWDPAGRGLTVAALANYVRHHVERWVAANRRAVQTPGLLGDTAVNFALRPLIPAGKGAADATAEDKAKEALLERLIGAWGRHDALSKRRPYRHAPLLWQRYRETLLRAERLVRADDRDEAARLLDGLPGLEKSIAEAAAGPAIDPRWSLGLLGADLAERPSEALAKEEKAGGERLEAALRELTEGARPEASPDPARPAAGATPPPEMPVKEKDDDKAKAALAARKTEPRQVPAKAVGKADAPSALPGLVVGDDDRAVYVEAQILIWARDFAKRSGTTNPFAGRRGDLLADSLKARRIAERAAAADERIAPRVAPLVEAGDELRRRAQDALFAGDSARLDAPFGLLEAARARYREALEVSGRAARSLDLIEEIEAEIPSYGRWQARMRDHTPEGLAPSFLELLRATAALARRVQADPPPAADADDVLERARSLEGLARDASAAFDRLRGEFRAQCDGLTTSGGASSWPDLDAVLLVPSIPSATRQVLLQRLRSAASASDFTAADPASRAEVAALKGDSPADPEFLAEALGLARLEIELLAIGGAPETTLARLGEAHQAARSAAAGDPVASLTDLGRLSELIRAARAERLKAARPGPAASPASLAEADRSLRLVPLADALGLSDAATEALDRRRRADLLTWHGRRLLRDFAPAHARLLLDDARRFGDGDALRAAIDEADAMAKSRLALEPEPDAAIPIREWAEHPMAVVVSAVGTVPPGDAALAVAYDPVRPLSVRDATTGQEARDGVLVPVRPRRDARRADFLVVRTESTAGALDVGLAPSAFYRGRFFAAGRDVRVSLDTAKEPVAITIRQSYEGLKFKDFSDQFLEHPGQGYLHYGTNLKYKLVLTSDRPIRAVVQYGLKEHPESFKVKTIEIGPKRPGEIIDVVRGDDFAIDKVEDKLTVPPLNLSVTVRKDRETGEVQGKARYTFRMIPPQRYISTKWAYDPDERLLYLYATHLAGDPVTGPVEVLASIGGSEMRAVIGRSRLAGFAFLVPRTVKKVRWRVGVESMPAAFVEEVETPVPPPEGGAAPKP